MTMTATDTPKAWVGCLGCYNDGDLVGRWLEDPDEIREYRCPRPVTVYNMHEELWVFDHENAPWLSGECSPSEFADKAEAFNAATGDHDPAVVAAYIANLGDDVDWDTLASDVGEAYAGEFTNVETWAYELASETTEDLDKMPYANYIDWAAVARDAVLGGDIWVHEAGFESVHIFWGNR